MSAQDEYDELRDCTGSQRQNGYVILTDHVSDNVDLPRYPNRLHVNASGAGSMDVLLTGQINGMDPVTLYFGTGVTTLDARVRRVTRMSNTLTVLALGAFGTSDDILRPRIELSVGQEEISLAVNGAGDTLGDENGTELGQVDYAGLLGYDENTLLTL